MSKSKTGYELRMSDLSSDVCSSDLTRVHCCVTGPTGPPTTSTTRKGLRSRRSGDAWTHCVAARSPRSPRSTRPFAAWARAPTACACDAGAASPTSACRRSEEHTSELQSLMRISYAVFCLKKKKTRPTNIIPHMPTDHLNPISSIENTYDSRYLHTH